MLMAHNGQKQLLHIALVQTEARKLEGQLWPIFRLMFILTTTGNSSQLALLPRTWAPTLSGC